jgi:hypothetical protein
MSTPIYHPEEAAQVTHQHLPPALREQLSEDDVFNILEMKFLADDEDPYETMLLCQQAGIRVSLEVVLEIARAEEVYLRMIGERVF